MLPRSNTLFHFTKSLHVLKSILKDGLWARYCLEDIEWHGGIREYIAYPMVCFCDIPISRIAEHVEFYGTFGVGLTKEWAIRNHLNPVMYLSKSSPLTEAVRQTIEMARNLSEEKQIAAFRNLRGLFAYAKPLTGRMRVSDQAVTKDFYQESEWRYVASDERVHECLSVDEFGNSDELTKHNEATKQFCPLKFEPTDVRYIFVPTDSDIPSIMNFIQTELDKYPSSDLKVLMSRVTSLESIQRDI